MSTIPIHFHDVFRVYERVTKLKTSAQEDRGRSGSRDLINISSEAKKRFVIAQAQSEVLEKIKK